MKSTRKPHRNEHVTDEPITMGAKRPPPSFVFTPSYEAQNEKFSSRHSPPHLLDPRILAEKAPSSAVIDESWCECIPLFLLRRNDDEHCPLTTNTLVAVERTCTPWNGTYRRRCSWLCPSFVVFFQSFLINLVFIAPFPIGNRMNMEHC